MVTHIQYYKLQMQHQAVPVSDISILTNPTSRKTVVSYDLAPDFSTSLNFGGVITQGFHGPSNHQQDQTMLRYPKLQMQSQAVPVSDFSILTNSTSRKTVTSSYMDPDPSTSFDSGGVTTKGSCGPILLHSSCHDFEEVEKRRKMSSQMWLCMM